MLLHRGPHLLRGLHAPPSQLNLHTWPPPTPHPTHRNLADHTSPSTSRVHLSCCGSRKVQASATAATAMDDTAVRVVQRQLELYNGRDVDTFMEVRQEAWRMSGRMRREVGAP